MFKHVSNPAFDNDAPVLEDELLRDYQYYSYDARIPDARGGLELQVQDTSRYFLPAEAFLEIEGERLTADDTAYGIGDRDGFVNSGVMGIFNSATHNVGGKNIESRLENVDVVTTILGLARYVDDYSRSAGPSMMFAKDTTDHPKNHNVTRNAAET